MRAEKQAYRRVTTKVLILPGYDWKWVPIKTIDAAKKHLK